MRDENATTGEVAVASHQGDRLVFIGKTVETIAAQATLPGVVGQGQQLLDQRHAVVEAGVEAGDLWHIGMRIEERFDAFERRGLVQRCQRDQPAQFLQHVRIDPGRREIAAAAVHDAMGDRAQRTGRRVLANVLAHFIERGAERVLGIEHERPRVLAAVVRPAWRAAADAVDLAAPARLLGRIAGVDIVEGKLQARRAGIENKDAGARIAHGGEVR